MAVSRGPHFVVFLSLFAPVTAAFPGAVAGGEMAPG